MIWSSVVFSDNPSTAIPITFFANSVRNNNTQESVNTIFGLLQNFQMHSNKKVLQICLPACLKKYVVVLRTLQLTHFFIESMYDIKFEKMAWSSLLGSWLVWSTLSYYYTYTSAFTFEKHVYIHPYAIPWHDNNMCTWCATITILFNAK